MHRLALVLLVLASCKSSRETTCDQLANMGTAFANELGKRVGAESDETGEIKSKMAELKAQCMKWPDEVFDCMRDNDETSPRCREAMSHVTGLVPSDVPKAPAGPKVVATAMIGDVSWEGMKVSLAADGTVTALIEEGLVAYDASGKPTWRVVMKHDDWMLAEGDLVLTADREKHQLVALDAGTGEAKWRVEIPQPDEYSSVTTEAGVHVGAAAYVALSTGNVLRVDPAACAAPKQKGCIATAFTLENEEFDGPDLFALGDDIVFAESNAIRRISTSGEIKGYIHVRDDLGGVTRATDDKVAAIFDDELVLIDFAKCTGPTGIELRRKQGRMYLRGEGECEDCRTPPQGCISRATVDDVDSIAPTVLRDGSMIASNWDGPLRATAAGTKQWASEADSVGPLREVGGAIVFLSRDEDEDKPLRVAALDSSTGKAKWATPLPSIASKDLSSSSEATVETNGDWLVVGVKGRIAWLKVD